MAAERARSILEHSMVALRHSHVCEDGSVLPEGSEGAVVHVYRGGAAYEVEFEKPFHCVTSIGRDEITLA